MFALDNEPSIENSRQFSLIPNKKLCTHTSRSKYSYSSRVSSKCLSILGNEIKQIPKIVPRTRPIDRKKPLSFAHLSDATIPKRIDIDFRDSLQSDHRIKCAINALTNNRQNHSGNLFRWQYLTSKCLHTLHTTKSAHTIDSHVLTEACSYTQLAVRQCVSTGVRARSNKFDFYLIYPQTCQSRITHRCRCI